MRIVKLVVAIFIILIGSYSAVWFYFTNKVAEKLNEEYASKQFLVKNLQKIEYFVKFNNIKPTGFPFKIAFLAEGWQEEGRSVTLKYSDPIEFGYDLLGQSIFASFSGAINAHYKQSENKEDVMLKVSDYSIKSSMPLTYKLFETLSNLEDAGVLLNYISGLQGELKGMKIFAKDGSLLHSRDYESVKLSFTPAKYYSDTEDILENIPKYYNIIYGMQTNGKSNRLLSKPPAAEQVLPSAIFLQYVNYDGLGEDIDLSLSASAKTSASKVDQILEATDVDSEVSLSTPTISIPSLKLSLKEHKVSQDQSNKFSLKTTGKFLLKDGFFNELFARYKKIRPHMVQSMVGANVDMELTYLIDNEKQFKFKELENKTYDFSLDLHHENQKHKAKLLQDFSILGSDTGFKLNHQCEMGLRSVLMKGKLFLHNYPAIIDFTAPYIYHFSFLKKLPLNSKLIYTESANEFLRLISDHPNSDSKDLSFEYSIYPHDIAKSKVGKVDITKLPDLFTVVLYRNALGKIDKKGGNLVEQMKKIIPDLDEHSPILKKILPDVAVQEKDKLDKLLPKKSKEAIKKALPELDKLF